MIKSRLIGCISLAVIFTFLVPAATAFAEPQWLVNGKTLAAAALAETEGKFTLKIKGAESEIECKMRLDGVVGPGGKDLWEKVLNLAGEEAALGVRALICPVMVDTGSALDCKAAENAEVFPHGLPWETLLVLVGARVVNIVVGEGYEVKCKTLTGLSGETECVAKELEPVATSEVSGGGFPASVLEVFSSESGEGECTVTKFNASIAGTGNTVALGSKGERLETSLEP